MSTQKKGRVAKPKVAKETPAVQPAVEPAPVAAPVAAPVVAAPVAAPVVAAPPKEAKEPKVVETSTSRVKSNLNTFGINAAVHALSDPLDEKIKAYKSAQATLASGKKSDTREVEKVVDGVATKVSESFERAITPAETIELKKVVDQHHQHITSMERDLQAYSQDLIRFAKNTPAAVAVVCDLITSSIIEAAMNNGVNQKEPHKNIGIREMCSADLESLPLAPLFRNLPSYVAVKTQFTTAQREKAEKAKIAVELKEQAKQLKRQFGITRKQVEAAKTAEVPVKEVEAEKPAVEAEKPADGTDRRTSLAHCVNEISKRVSKTKFPGQKLRTSGALKEHIAQLLKEFLQRLSPLLAHAVRFDDSKTVKVSTVEFVLEFMLIDGHTPVETIELVNVDVPNPEILKAEEVKKAAEKAAGRKYTIDLTKIPKSIGREVVHTVTYPTSGFADLKASINKALASMAANPETAAN